LQHAIHREYQRSFSSAHNLIGGTPGVGCLTGYAGHIAFFDINVF
jgi:hypothetical protein